MSTVSTIIPTHNCAGTLGEALDSIAAQRLKPAEVIVVDDGSTDNTAEVVEARAGSLPNVSYVKQEQRGASAARNAGAAKARGDLLHFFDADDLLLPDFYLHMVTVLAQSPEMGAACCQRFYQYGRSTRRYAADRCWVRELPLGAAMEMDNPFDTLTTLVRRAVFDELGGFNEAFPIVQDVEFAYRMLALVPAEVSPEHHAVYRQHGRGLSDTGVSTHIERLLRAEEVAATDRAAYGVMVDTYLQYWLAVFFEQAGRLDEVEARLERLLAASPDHPGGRLLRVRLLLARCQIAEARSEAEALHERFPACGQVVAAMGHVAAAEGKFDHAAGLLGWAVKVELDEVERQRHGLELADLLARSGSPEEASGVFAAVLDEAEARDVRPRALAGLAFLRAVSGEWAAADEVLAGEADAAVALRARYNMASQLEAVGYGEEAMAEFERVAASPAAESAGLADGAHYHLGSLHMVAGDMDGARTCFEECLRLNPHHQQAAAMLRGLQHDLSADSRPARP